MITLYVATGRHLTVDLHEVKHGLHGPDCTEFFDGKWERARPARQHSRLESKQRCLARQTPTITDQLAVGTYHPVARHYDRDRVAPVGKADSARGIRVPHAP